MREIAVLVALGCLASACAFTDIPLTLPTHGLEHTISGGKDRQVIVVVPFSDERKIRERCGMQKNGYNMDTADAVRQSDPNTWIAQLLADELRASGFSVLDDHAERRPTALRIEGALTQIFVEPVIGASTMQPYHTALHRATQAILGGCARHFVVERGAGRVDSERSITTNSDTEWTVQHEPDPRTDAGRGESS